MSAYQILLTELDRCDYIVDYQYTGCLSDYTYNDVTYAETSEAYSRRLERLYLDFLNEWSTLSEADKQAAKAIVEQTGCDGIMLGRGLQGNPWLIGQILYGKDKPTIEEIVEMVLRHARMQVEFAGEYMGIRQMRKHVAWYTTGYPGSAKLRGMVNQVESMEALESLMRTYENHGKQREFGVGVY